jgi:hypothetical protein
MKDVSVALLRLSIWLIVAIWCSVPLILYAVNTANTVSQSIKEEYRKKQEAKKNHKTDYKKEEQKKTEQPDYDYGRPTPISEETGTDTGLMGWVMSSIVLIFCFLYGCWCCVGVICGFGMERTLSASDQLITLALTKTLKKPPVKS